MRRRAWWVLAAAVAWGERLNGRWSRTLVGNAAGETEAVVVLGFRNPQPSANVINRWRVRAGVRSVSAEHETTVILCGGSNGRGTTEARLMADYATSVLGFDGRLLLEEESRTTWENITNVVPLLKGMDRIKIVSQPAHGLKARAYLRRQRPDLAAKLVRADDHRPFEEMFLKPLLAAHGLRLLRRLTREERTRRSP